MSRNPTNSVAPTTTTAAAQRPALWIIDGGRDFALFFGTPFLILPLVMLAERIWAASSLYMVVAAFGALGHHLPGMMRAYGDRALFQRFKTRFIAAPIFLVAVCAGLATVDPNMNAVMLIAYSWGVWHGLMQTHGFLRIYDARVKSFHPWTARLDQWMCLTWFVAGVLFSQSRVHHILDSFYGLGGPAVPLATIDTLRLVWGALTVTVTLGFIVNAAARWRTGTPPSPVKLFLLVTSIAFWLYCCTGVRNLLVGILMFEIFHDVQYLSIVWLFNRGRARNDPTGMGRLSRRLFGTSGALAGVYVGLVFAYGSLYFFNLEVQRYTPVFGAILAASALLHFYYDGFIWKVREQTTRAALGLQGGRQLQRARELFPGMAHAVKWSPFVAVVAACLVLYSRPAMTGTEARVLLGSMFPNYDLAQANMAAELHAAGDLERAIAADRHILALGSDDLQLLAEAHNNLAWGLTERAEELVQRGDEQAAQPLAREAFELDTEIPHQLNNEATALLRAGRGSAAISKYRVALLMTPARARIHMNLALALASENRMDEALHHARVAQRSIPQDATLIRLVRQLEEHTREK